jgi:hypothetical protein
MLGATSRNFSKGGMDLYLVIRNITESLGELKLAAADVIGSSPAAKAFGDWINEQLTDLLDLLTATPKAAEPLIRTLHGLSRGLLTMFKFLGDLVVRLVAFIDSSKAVKLLFEGIGIGIRFTIDALAVFLEQLVNLTAQLVPVVKQLWESEDAAKHASYALGGLGLALAAGKAATAITALHTGLKLLTSGKAFKYLLGAGKSLLSLRGALTAVGKTLSGAGVALLAWDIAKLTKDVVIFGRTMTEWGQIALAAIKVVGEAIKIVIHDAWEQAKKYTVDFFIWLQAKMTTFITWLKDWRKHLLDALQWAAEAIVTIFEKGWEGVKLVSMKFFAWLTTSSEDSLSMVGKLMKAFSEPIAPYTPKTADKTALTSAIQSLSDLWDNVVRKAKVYIDIIAKKKPKTHDLPADTEQGARKQLEFDTPMGQQRNITQMQKLMGLDSGEAQRDFNTRMSQYEKNIENMTTFKSEALINQWEAEKAGNAEAADLWEARYQQHVLEIARMSGWLADQRQKHEGEVYVHARKQQTALLQGFSTLAGQSAGMLNELTERSSKHTKAFWASAQLMKASQAIMNTALAVTAVMARSDQLGPAGTAAMVTWTRLMGAAQVALIMTQKMPGYAAGTDYVPNTGPAMLHKGEAVLTADQNRNRANYTNVTINQEIVGSIGEQEIALVRSVAQAAAHDAVNFALRNDQPTRRAVRNAAR